MTTDQTEFRRWRDAMGFSQAKAAEMLGVSLSQIKNYDSGVHRGTGDTSVPSLATRMLMAVLAAGIEVEPWPDVPRKAGKRKPR
jgi:transcriptional regulator with XRE-family HTH domain